MRRTIRNSAVAVALVASTAVGMTACSGNSKPSATSAQAAQNNTAANEFSEFNAAVPYPYQSQAPSDPLERKNLAARLKEYNSSGDTNYVYVFAGMTSQVVGYYVIKGKVSSTGSEMTSTDVNVHCGYNSTNQACTNVAIGDDGSYGPEEGGNSGVFFFTTNGTLVETDQPFLVSDAPIKIYSSVPNLDTAAH